MIAITKIPRNVIGYPSIIKLILKYGNVNLQLIKITLNSEETIPHPYPFVYLEMDKKWRYSGYDNFGCCNELDGHKHAISRS